MAVFFVITASARRIETEDAYSYYIFMKIIDNNNVKSSIVIKMLVVCPSGVFLPKPVMTFNRAVKLLEYSQFLYCLLCIDVQQLLYCVSCLNDYSPLVCNHPKRN